MMKKYLLLIGMLLLCSGLVVAGFGDSRTIILKQSSTGDSFNSSDYYTINQTYNQTQIDSLIASANASPVSYWNETGGVLEPATTTNSVNIATGEEYQQNNINLISVPSTSATSLTIGNTGFTGTGNYNLLIGNSAGDDLTTATSNVMMGDHAGFRQTGKNNVYIGYQAGYGVNGASNGEANIGIGKNSLLSVTTGYNNIAIGLEAGNKIARALYNNYIGTYAGRYQTGSGNSALGYNALAGVNGASNGVNNIVMGYYAGSEITTGSTNLLLGRNNGLGLSTHSGNVFLGYEVGKTNLVASNQLAIDNKDTATPLIYGDFSTDELTINGDLNVTGTISNSLAHMHGAVTTIHTVPVVDTWYNLTFNASLGDVANVNFIDNRTIVITHDGHYSITFGMGIEDSSANPTSHVGMRIALNGAEMPLSYVEEDPFKQNSDMWLEHTTHYELSTGDELNMQYIASDTNVVIKQEDTYATQSFHAYGYLQEVIV